MYPTVPNCMYPTVPNYMYPTVPNYMYPTVPNCIYPTVPNCMYPTIPNCMYPTVGGCCSPAVEKQTADKRDVETGGEDISDIILAAKDANAHDFLMSFTNGYDTDVGESSMMVSEKITILYTVVMGTDRTLAC